MVSPVPESILSGISRGQSVASELPEIFSKGRARGREEESQRLVGLILSKTIGGKLGALGKVDAPAALQLSQAFGIPVNAKERRDKMVQDIVFAATIFEKVGPREAAEYAAEQAALLEGLDIQPDQYLETIQGLTSQDPEEVAATGQSLIDLRDGFFETGIAKRPKVDKKTPAFRTLKDRAIAAGMKPGTPKFQEFMLHGGPAPKTGRVADQRDRKISDYQRLFDKTEEEATRAVDSATMIDDKGNLITFDPISGEGKLVDVDTGVESPIITPPEGVTIEDLSFDPAKGTGFGASFIGLWNSTFGQIPFLPIGKETETAAQYLRIIERDAVLALASSGRPPLVEQQRIIKLVPEAMDWFQNPEVARFKMTNFINLMMNQYVDDIRYSQNRRNPKKVRDESVGRARRIESIVRRVLTPEASQAMFDSLNKMETELREIRDMSTKELDSVDSATLSKSQTDAYIDRVRSDIEDLERLMSNGG